MKIFRTFSPFFFPVVALFLLFLFSSGHVFADVFEQLRKDAAEIRSIQAKFTQNKSMKILAKPLVSEGRFYYAAPDSLRWEYLKPLKSVIITHKGKTKRYFFSGGKFIEDQTGGVQAMSIVLNEISAWMSGKFDQNPSFQADLKETENLEITLTPTGKNMTGMIENIFITLSKKDKAVKTVKIVENENSVTRIDFTGTIINKAIPEEIFQDVQ